MSANSEHFEVIGTSTKKKKGSELSEAIGVVGKGFQNFAQTINYARVDKKEQELYALKMELAHPKKAGW